MTTSNIWFRSRFGSTQASPCCEYARSEAARRNPFRPEARHAIRPSLLLFAFLALAAPGALADTDVDETREQLTEQARNIRRLWLDFQDQVAGLRVRLDQGADVGARYDDTEVHWLRTRLSVTGGLPLPSEADSNGANRGVAVGLSSALIRPEIDGSRDFLDLPGADDDPLDELLDSSFRLGGELPIGWGVSGVLVTGLTARHEIGADLKSALAVGGSLALRYRRGEWLRVRLGVGLGTNIDQASLSATPVFRLRVRPVPRLWLETDITSGRIEWEATPRLTTVAFAGIDSKRYRLAERGGSVGAGSLELRKTEVGIGVQVRIGAHFRIRGEAAVVVGTHLTVFDEDGNRVDARDTRDPSGALRISFEWRR